MRVYIIYFWETPFSPSCACLQWHMHIHLFPRTRAMVGRDDPTVFAAWEFMKLIKRASFPPDYRVSNGNVKHLMNSLMKKIAC